MKYVLNYVLKYLCLSLAFLLPLTTHADFTGEVFFTKLVTKQEERKIFSEIWITDIENAKSAHLLYRDKYEIHDYAIQNNGPLLVISAGPLTSDIFLLNRFQLGAGAIDLTKAKFGATAGVDISPNGDVLFSKNGIRSFVLGNTTFAVEPMNRLTTLWGKLKQ